MCLCVCVCVCVRVCVLTGVLSPHNFILINRISGVTSESFKAVLEAEGSSPPTLRLCQASYQRCSTQPGPAHLEQQRAHSLWFLHLHMQGTPHTSTQATQTLLLSGPSPVLRATGEVWVNSHLSTSLFLPNHMGAPHCPLDPLQVAHIQVTHLPLRKEHSSQGF